MGIKNPITAFSTLLHRPKVSRRVLFTAEILVFLAVCTTILAVLHLHPIPLSLFLLIGQPFFIIGIALYLLVVIAKFLSHHGTSQVDFGPGEIIFNEGDKGDFVYSIIEGNVEVMIKGPGGVKKIIAKLGPGDYFGEMALITNRPRNATARATSTVKTMTISQRDFMNLHDYMPSLQKNIDMVIEGRMVELKAKSIGATSKN